MAYILIYIHGNKYLLELTEILVENNLVKSTKFLVKFY